MIGSVSCLNSLFCCLQVNSTKVGKICKPLWQRQILLKSKKQKTSVCQDKQLQTRGNSLRLIQTFGINHWLAEITCWEGFPETLILCSKFNVLNKDSTVSREFCYESCAPGTRQGCQGPCIHYLKLQGFPLWAPGAAAFVHGLEERMLQEHGAGVTLNSKWNSILSLMICVTLGDLCLLSEVSFLYIIWSECEVKVA